MSEPVVLVANGDLRLAANQKCWPAQESVEAAVVEAIRRAGREVKRGHTYDPAKQHGFIDSQKYGMEVFRNISPTAPLVAVEAVWQYSHHLLHGLYTHRGPILTVANWSREWPGIYRCSTLRSRRFRSGALNGSMLELQSRQSEARCQRTTGSRSRIQMRFSKQQNQKSSA